MCMFYSSLIISFSNFGVLFRRICATHQRHRGPPCWGSPPGRGQRAHCDKPECRKNEHKCHVYTRKTREFCDELIAGDLFDSCDDHKEYVIGCPDCTENIKPKNHFCENHMVFEEAARKKLENDKKYFHYREIINVIEMS